MPPTPPVHRSRTVVATVVSARPLRQGSSSAPTANTVHGPTVGCYFLLFILLSYFFSEPLFCNNTATSFRLLTGLFFYRYCSKLGRDHRVPIKVPFGVVDARFLQAGCPSGHPTNQQRKSTNRSNANNNCNHRCRFLDCLSCL